MTHRFAGNRWGKWYDLSITILQQTNRYNGGDETMHHWFILATKINEIYEYLQIMKAACFILHKLN